jgi:hypothetical protein
MSCTKLLIANSTKTSRIGFEQSGTSRIGSEPNKRASHSGDKGTVVTAARRSLAMSDDPQQVTALIKELLILNRGGEYYHHRALDRERD